MTGDVSLLGLALLKSELWENCSTLNLRLCSFSWQARPRRIAQRQGLDPRYPSKQVWGVQRAEKVGGVVNYDHNFNSFFEVCNIKHAEGVVPGVLGPSPQRFTLRTPSRCRP